jgi:prepilin signal peptidase PulO-like enzyme (type II secretory pathway)
LPRFTAPTDAFPPSPVRPGPPGSFGYRLARLNIVEASAIGVIGLAAVTASVAGAPGWSGGAGAVLAALMLAIAVIDYRQMIIPDELNALAFIDGLAAAGVSSEDASSAAILEPSFARALRSRCFLPFAPATRSCGG